MTASTPPHRRTVLGVLALFAILIADGLRLDEFLLSRSRGIVVVEGMWRVERDCPGSPALGLGGSLRSGRQPWRCGVVMTDRGGFAILPSWSALPFAMARGDMVDLLERGGCFELRWFGYQEDPTSEGPTNPSPRNTIYHVAPADGCGAGEPRDLGLAWDVLPEGVLLHVRVDLGASLDGIVGPEPARDRGAVLRVRLTTPPGGGSGEAALLSFLARRLGLPSSDLSLAGGQGARLKAVRIEGDPADIATSLRDLVEPTSR